MPWLRLLPATQVDRGVLRVLSVLGPQDPCLYLLGTKGFFRDRAAPISTGWEPGEARKRRRVKNMRTTVWHASDMLYDEKLRSVHSSSDPVISFSLIPSWEGRREEDINMRQAYQEFEGMSARTGELK